MHLTVSYAIGLYTVFTSNLLVSQLRQPRAHHVLWRIFPNRIDFRHRTQQDLVRHYFAAINRQMAEVLRLLRYGHACNICDPGRGHSLGPMQTNYKDIRRHYPGYLYQ
jgi:hypothetical protein